MTALTTADPGSASRKASTELGCCAAMLHALATRLSACAPIVSTREMVLRPRTPAELLSLVSTHAGPPFRAGTKTRQGRALVQGRWSPGGERAWPMAAGAGAEKRYFRRAETEATHSDPPSIHCSLAALRLVGAPASLLLAEIFLEARSAPGSLAISVKRRAATAKFRV